MIESRLQRGLAALQMTVTAAQTTKLLEYLALLQKWNRAYNLSAIRDPDAMVDLHLLDSLAVAPYLTGTTFVDVGSGGGLPGIPLAIIRPDIRMTVLDSVGKKARFLHQVRSELRLTNIEVVHARVEDYRTEDGYDGVISRAFASLADFVASSAHLLHPDGRFWAMKGQFPQTELDGIHSVCKLEAMHYLSVPGLEAMRCLIVLGQQLPAHPESE